MVLIRSGPIRFSAQRPSSIGVVGLHGRDHAEPGDAADVLPAKVLRVLDPEAAVARAMRPGDAVVDVEQQPVGSLADGVDRHLQAGGIGAPIQARSESSGVTRRPLVSRRIVVGLIEQRGGRAERAVHVALDARRSRASRRPRPSPSPVRPSGASPPAASRPRPG